MKVAATRIAKWTYFDERISCSFYCTLEFMVTAEACGSIWTPLGFTAPEAAEIEVIRVRIDGMALREPGELPRFIGLTDDHRDLWGKHVFKCYEADPEAAERTCRMQLADARAK